jgi:hypothetical protein
MAAFAKSRWNVCNDPLVFEAIRIPLSHRSRVRQLARERGISKAEAFRLLIADALSRVAPDDQGDAVGAA